VPKVRVRKVGRSDLKGKKSLFAYVSDSYYKTKRLRKTNGWDISLRRKRFAAPFKKRIAESIVEGYKGDTEIYLADVEGEDAGWIQIEHQKWNNSVRVWDIGVEPRARRSGVGTALMDKCKERALKFGARRIVLETQTSNADAIDFYLSQGFDLVGFDLTGYTNEDTRRREVRLELAYHMRPRPRRRVTR
jgi:ribosomal protein S18 acetylase RimI-like enzyme